MIPRPADFIPGEATKGYGLLEEEGGLRGLSPRWADPPAHHDED
jgi:hypothetical protein